MSQVGNNSRNMLAKPRCCNTWQTMPSMHKDLDRQHTSLVCTFLTTKGKQLCPMTRMGMCIGNTALKQRLNSFLNARSSGSGKNWSCANGLSADQATHCNWHKTVIETKSNNCCMWWLGRPTVWRCSLWCCLSMESVHCLITCWIDWIEAHRWWHWKCLPQGACLRKGVCPAPNLDLLKATHWSLKQLCMDAKFVDTLHALGCVSTHANWNVWTQKLSQVGGCMHQWEIDCIEGLWHILQGTSVWSVELQVEESWRAQVSLGRWFLPWQGWHAGLWCSNPCEMSHQCTQGVVWRTAKGSSCSFGCG